MCERVCVFALSESGKKKKKLHFIVKFGNDNKDSILYNSKKKCAYVQYMNYILNIYTQHYI